MLKPIKLFGVEQKQQPVFFIHNDGEGYWFLSTKSRLVGEARFLKDITTEMQRIELTNSWLILEIISSKLELITEKYLQDNPEEADTFSALDKDTKQLKLELFVRNLIKDGDFSNPILWEYKDRIVDTVINGTSFDYQLYIVKAGFNYRVITDDNYITKDPNDNEKGYINTLDTIGNNFIGYQLSDDDLGTLSEQLVLTIYRFLQDEFNSREHLTTKEREALIEVTETSDDDEEDSEEKKNLVEVSSEESKTITTP